jgi:hypothetical protein
MKHGAGVTLSLVVLTLGMTWPLPAGLARDVPGDLGDPLLNMWILGWGAEQLPRLVSAGASFRDVWSANVFHPEPLALTLSEHLFGQVVQVLAVYHLSGNLILCYNLLFLSSFVLSGLGMYLLARDLLADGSQPGVVWAALVAGLAYAFAPLRVAQLAHIQSLSSHWMPLALYGFRRFVRTPGIHLRPLAGGTAALLMQNWSSGYYLVYFTPLAVLFTAHQVVCVGRAREWRLWAALAVSAGIVAAGTWPFLSVYLEGRSIHGIDRALGEVVRYSADVYSYLTAPEGLRLWGSVVRAYPKAEGELFVGVVPIALVLLALADWTRRAFIGAPAPDSTLGGRVLAAGRGALVLFIAVQFAGLAGVLLTGGFVASVAGVSIRATHAPRILAGLTIAVACLLIVSPRARGRARAAIQSPLLFALGLAAIAVWLSLGPMPQSRGQPLAGLGLYGLLYEHVPGMDGLRAPARYAMVAVLFLSIAAGYGARVLLPASTRRVLVAAPLCAALLLEGAFAPMPVNQTWGDDGPVPPPRIEPASRAPAVYRHLATMPGALVVAEFPFGDPEWDLRYVYYSTVHWKRLVNGYSGYFPQRYQARVARLARPMESPDDAWRALADTGVTHVIVHETAFPERGEPITGWLTGHGAREIARFESAVLYDVPR